MAANLRTVMVHLTNYNQLRNDQDMEMRFDHSRLQKYLPSVWLTL
jgi:hypothetical protein